MFFPSSRTGVTKNAEPIRNCLSIEYVVLSLGYLSYEKILKNCLYLKNIGKKTLYSWNKGLATVVPNKWDL